MMRYVTVVALGSACVAGAQDTVTVHPEDTGAALVVKVSA